MKYFKLLQFELKSIVKDKMNMFMLLYPAILVVLMGILLPLSTKNLTEVEIASSFPFVFMVILCVGPIIGGMLMGFSVLENKDERTLNTIAVTPISLKGYIIFKSLYSSIISFLGNLLVIYGIKILAASSYLTFNPNTLEFISIFNLINFWQIFMFSFACATLTPAVGLILAALAKNKVEGLVLIKTAGLVLVLPALALLDAFRGANQYFLSLFPNFWFIKAIQNIVLFDSSPANLPFYLYMVIGLAFTFLLSYFSYKFFTKKIQISN